MILVKVPWDRDVVQALVGNAARGRMRMSCGNHDVRFRVFRSILGADTLDQLHLGETASR